jgi:hypothetical protein
MRELTLPDHDVGDGLRPRFDDHGRARSAQPIDALDVGSHRDVPHKCASFHRICSSHDARPRIYSHSGDRAL